MHFFDKKQVSITLIIPITFYAGFVAYNVAECNIVPYVDHTWKVMDRTKS